MNVIPHKVEMARNAKDPYFDPLISYQENYNKGPFGAFADGIISENQGEPRFSLFGFSLFSDFGIPAGPLLNGKYTNAALEKGFDIVTYKTVRSREHPCSQWPNVLAVDVPGNLTLELAEKGLTGSDEYKEPLGITNSFGVPSANPSVWQPDMTEAVKHAGKGQLVICSFQGTKTPDGNVDAYIADFAETARLVKETGAKVLEINLSCPNEGTADLLCFDLERTQKVVEAVRKQIGNETPLIIKIAYFPDQAQLTKLVQLVGPIVDGISTINTIPAKIFDKAGQQALPGPNRLKAGVCGAPIKWAGLEMVSRLKDLREQQGLSFTILGVGGVTNVDDYRAYKEAGADAVLSATGGMWNPYLAQEIKKSL